MNQIATNNNNTKKNNCKASNGKTRKRSRGQSNSNTESVKIKLPQNAKIKLFDNHRLISMIKMKHKMLKFLNKKSGKFTATKKTEEIT